MKFKLIRVFTLIVSLLLFSLVGAAYAQDFDESDLMSMTIDVNFETGPEDSDGILLTDGPITIILHIANFAESKLEARWVIDPGGLLQTEENTYENIHTGFMQSIVAYEIWEHDEFAKDLTEYLDFVKVKINANSQQIVKKVKLDVSSESRVLLPVCSTKETEVKNNKVTLVGFGTFMTRTPTRTERNPQTGETIKIKAKTVVKFRVAK